TRGPLPSDATIRVVREVSLALAHAHDHGVIHRDVKPDNILIDRSTGSSFVTDFGIARFGAGPVSGSRTVLGTPEFMSPEQARGLALDARSDLYSLGVVGFYAASGRLPFDATDSFMVMSQHVTDPPPPLATVAPHVPKHVADLVDRCLLKDPAQRPSGGTVMAEVLTPAPEPRPAPPLAVRAFVTQERQWGGLATAIARARRLLRAGHGREDLIHALRVEHARRVEELAFGFGARGPRTGRFLRLSCYLALGGAAVGTAGVVSGILPATGRVAGALAGAAAGALVLAFAARRHTEDRTDRHGARRVRWWSGAAGRWVFRLAGWRLPADPPATPGALTESA
ncbi:MAG TPA: serine/threonine-protein kinase, partial [Gemmatimonadales bacterium]|nr:serine/threonine-protein kinase [Gemmatimonadales bacterium]